MTQRPRVALLATGGTIAGQGTSSTALTDYRAAALGPEALLAAVPELSSLADLHLEQVAALHSADMAPAFWLQLAQRINHVLAAPDISGVVVTHGTATLEESAWFCNLVVRSAKPVVFTGAMRPASALSADGPLNLYQAVAVAASPQAVDKGVLVVMNGQINAARDVTKTNTLGPEAFCSPDFGLLGYVVDASPSFYRASLRLHTLHTPFDLATIDTLPRVDILHADAGTPLWLLNILRDASCLRDAIPLADGLVCAGLGGGAVPAQLAAVLRPLAAAGLPVVRATRVGSGPVCPQASDDVDKFLCAGTLSPQKARILLMLALTQTRARHEIASLFESC